MKRKPEKPLTDDQKKAVEMLYHYRRVNEVASALGVHRSTVWRWKKLRSFRREWKRLDRNAWRRFERKMEKERAEAEIYWSVIAEKAEKKLYQEAEKVKQKPGKSLNNAWNGYVKALLRGKTPAQVFDEVLSDKPKAGKD